MIACIAQMGPQVWDPKLASLRSKLSARWDCQVKFSAMDPRQDWMWCTIPDVSSPRKEILTTALMRLSDGNASYIVRHFGQPSLTRDLTFTVKGQSGDANAIYTQLRKCLLEFEARGIFLGWRVLGVQRSNTPFQFRATFLLDRATIAWPWQMLHGHVHSSMNPQLPLLNFDLPWQAKKPYACQACYSSIHPSHECPLISIRLGGMAIVSHISITAVLTKKVAERLIVVDCSLVPKKPAQPAEMLGMPIIDKGKAKAPLSVVSEGSVLARPDSVSMFLSMKLHQVVSQGLLSEEDIMGTSANGSVTSAFKALSEKLPLLSKISLDAVLSEFDKWEALAVLPTSIANCSDHSMHGSEALSEVIPSSLTPPLLPSELRPLGCFPEMEDESHIRSYVAQAPAAINNATSMPGMPPGGASNPAPPQPTPSEPCPNLCYAPTTNPSFYPMLLARPTKPRVPLDATLADLDPLLTNMGPILPAPQPPSPITLFLLPSPLTPIPGPDWARRPDPEDTREDIDAALNAILGDSHQQPTISTFVAPPPSQPATTEDWSAAIDTIRAANPSDPSIPLSDWEPTLPVAAPASLAGAPPQAALAVTEEALTNDMAALQNAHPTYRADFLLASLENCNMNLAATLAWLATVQDVKSIVEQMRCCFLLAKKAYITQVTQDLGGDISAIWAHLSQEFISPWATKFTSSSIQRDAVRNAQQREDNASEHSMILLASSGIQKFEKDWWTSYHTSRRYHLGESSPHEAFWDLVCEEAAVNFPVSPQFVKCVESLGLCHTNTALFKGSVILL